MTIPARVPNGMAEDMAVHAAVHWAGPSLPRLNVWAFSLPVHQRDLYAVHLVYFLVISNRGRVVKATDLKSVGVSPRRFEPCRLRRFFIIFAFALSFFCQFSLCCPS